MERFAGLKKMVDELGTRTRTAWRSMPNRPCSVVDVEGERNCTQARLQNPARSVASMLPSILRALVLSLTRQLPLHRLLNCQTILFAVQ